MEGKSRGSRIIKSTPPGVARQQVTFSCFAKEKVTKKKATPVYRRYAVPCVARLVRRLRNSRFALKQSSPTSPDQPALLGGAQGIKKQKINGEQQVARHELGSQNDSTPIPFFEEEAQAKEIIVIPRVAVLKRTTLTAS